MIADSIEITKFISRADITGVILAGGRGRRLGGVDKGLVQLNGRPLIEHAIEAMRPQVGHLMISANRHHEQYAMYGFPVVADILGDHYGPLAGILSAMRRAQTPWLACVPCDAPALAPDLVKRLSAVMAADSEMSVAFVDGRLQPVFALMRCSLAKDVECYLKEGGRKAQTWCRQRRLVLADFSASPEMFRNINTPADLNDHVNSMKPI